MPSYQLLTAIQAILIIICAFSVTDYGVEIARTGEENEEGLGLNKFLFDEGNGLPDTLDFLADNDFWGYIQFWGYLMLLVGILQAIKVTSVKS
ncbi:MAG: hypothetical protein ACE5OZ_06515 [Candidatus Heimdallarchaeota archaeon]